MAQNKSSETKCDKCGKKCMARYYEHKQWVCENCSEYLNGEEEK